MQAGKISRWIDDRGFGFIQPDDGGAAIFVHISKIRSGVRIEPGCVVNFEVGANERSGKSEAQRVVIVRGL